MSDASLTPNTVVLGLPTYQGPAGMWLPTQVPPSRRFRVLSAEAQGSLLTQAFNNCWVAALNLRVSHAVRYFAMCHADVLPPPCFVDSLVDELEARDFDILSCVVPIKDERGLTSTAIDDPADPFDPLFRLTMREVMGLPETFTAADVGYPGNALLVNTGCWVCRFTEPWAEEVCFTVRDRVRKDPEKSEWVADVEPEDWGFSRWAHARGLKVAATRKLAIKHYGNFGFGNGHAWGSWETDTSLRSKKRGAV